jgi:hypothetical protein
MHPCSIALACYDLSRFQSQSGMDQRPVEMISMMLVTEVGVEGQLPREPGRCYLLRNPALKQVGSPLALI